MCRDIHLTKRKNFYHRKNFCNRIFFQILYAIILKALPTLKGCLTPDYTHTMHFLSCSYTTENENGWKILFYRDTIYKAKCFDEMETTEDIQLLLYQSPAIRGPSCQSLFSQYQEKPTSALEIQRLLLHEFRPGLSFVFSPCAFHLKEMIAIWF